jgi:hypothetical protein
MDNTKNAKKTEETENTPAQAQAQAQAHPIPTSRSEAEDTAAWLASAIWAPDDKHMHLVAIALEFGSHALNCAKRHHLACSCGWSMARASLRQLHSKQPALTSVIAHTPE